MVTEKRNSIAKPKPWKSAMSHKHKSQYSNGHTQHTQEWTPLPNSQLSHSPNSPLKSPYPGFTALGDSTLPIHGKRKVIPSEKNLGLKGSSEVVVPYGDRSSRLVKGSTSYRNYTHGSSRSVACRDEVLSDESDDPNQDFYAMKKQRLNCINKDEDAVCEDSEADMIATDLNFGKSTGSVLHASTKEDFDELRKQRSRDATKRSRLKKKRECEQLQERIEVLKADSSAICKELRSLAEECERLDEENKLIKEELVQMFGPDAISDITESWPELLDQD